LRGHVCSRCFDRFDRGHRGPPRPFHWP